MEENIVKNTCGGTRLEFRIEKYEKFLIENGTRCQIHYWKSDKTKKKLFQNLTRCIFFSGQNVTRCFFCNPKFDT